MTVKVTEAIKKCLGWCPKQAAAPFGGGMSAPDREIPVPGDGDAHVADGVVVDYQSPGLPIAVFIVLVAGIALGLQLIFFFTIRPVSSLVAAMIPLAFIGALILMNMKKSRVEITGVAITLHRSFRRPAVIPREAVTSAAVTKNAIPLSPLAIRLVLVVMLALHAVYGVFGPADPLSVSFIIVPLLFLVALYHAYSRAVYARTVVITTADRKVASIFTDDPDKIIRALGES